MSQADGSRRFDLVADPGSCKFFPARMPVQPLPQWYPVIGVREQSMDAAAARIVAKIKELWTLGDIKWGPSYHRALQICCKRGGADWKEDKCYICCHKFRSSIWVATARCVGGKEFMLEDKISLERPLEFMSLLKCVRKYWIDFTSAKDAGIEFDVQIRSLNPKWGLYSSRTATMINDGTFLQFSTMRLRRPRLPRDDHGGDGGGSGGGVDTVSAERVWFQESEWLHPAGQYFQTEMLRAQT